MMERARKMNNNMQHEVTGYDFEKYASVILYINAYCEQHMSPQEINELINQDDSVKYQIPVTQELLRLMDLDETIEEFCNEAQIMQNELDMDEDMQLLYIEHTDDEITLFVDPFILAILTDKDEMDDDDENQEEDPDEDVVVDNMPEDKE